MSSHIRKGVEFVCDPRILENQRKILQYIRNFQEEQNRIRQDVHMIMKESKHFQRTIHENVRVLNDNINSVLDYVEDLNECTDHMKDRLKSVYKYVKQMSSHQEALSSDTDSNIRPRRQPGRPTRAKLKPSGLLPPDDKSFGGYSPDSDTDISQFGQPLTVSLPTTSTKRASPTLLYSQPSTTWKRSSFVDRPVPSGTSSAGESTVSDTGFRSRTFSPQPPVQPVENNSTQYAGNSVRLQQMSSGVQNVEIPVTPNLPIDDLVQQPLVQPPLVKPVSSKTECVNIAKQLGLQVSEETVTAMERAAQGVDDSAEKFGLDEFISIITFGKSTAILQPFTNTYTSIRGVVENSLERLISGRSPLLTALLTALCYIESNGDAISLHSHDIFPRIVIISDFTISNDRNLEGIDTVAPEEFNQVQIQLFKFIGILKKRRYQTFCVPIGDYNKKFCEEIERRTDSSVIHPDNFEHAGFYYRYQIIAANCLYKYEVTQGQGLEDNFDDLLEQALLSAGLTPQHKEIVMTLITLAVNNDPSMDKLEGGTSFGARESVVQNVSPTLLNDGAFSNEGSQNNTITQEDDLNDLPEWRIPKGISNLSLEELGRLPPLGSRVKRGKDWTWRVHDGNGPGTIVGHKSEGVVFVVWDKNNQLGSYRYGFQGQQYDVELDKSDKSVRLVDPGEIEIGCLVTRGNDWCKGDEDGGEGKVGVVIRKLPGRLVQVRWPSRVIETYKFGADDKWEVKVTSGKSTSTEGHSQQMSEGSAMGNTATERLTTPVEETQAVWKWQDASEQWRIFSYAAINKLEQAFSKNPSGNVMVQNRGKNNKVYLDSFECEIGGSKRPISREMIKVSEAMSLQALEDLMNDG